MFFMTDFDDEDDEVQSNENESSDEEFFQDANDQINSDHISKIKPLIDDALLQVALGVNNCCDRTETEILFRITHNTMGAVL